MWNKCKLWVIDSIISTTLFLLVPILLISTNLVSISVAPEAALIVLGYILYIFQCVFTHDMKRGYFALIDLWQNKTVTRAFFVQEMQPHRSRFSVSRRHPDQSFETYYILRCMNISMSPICLFSAKRLYVEVNRTYKVEYLPLSRIVVNLTLVE